LDVKIQKSRLQEVILFFQNPADPKIQFDASTTKNPNMLLACPEDL
jgi:hypothetical protein